MERERTRWTRNLLTAKDEDDIPVRMRVEGGVIETFRVQNYGIPLKESSRREGVGGESG
jgi:hypothetical protein